MASDRGKRPSTTAAATDEEHRAGRTGSRDRRGLDAAAKKRGGKQPAEGTGDIASGGYAEQTPRAKRPHRPEQRGERQRIADSG